jgi:hypothetical protein
VLVDLDLRRPAIGKFFGIARSQPGLTNVVVGSVPLERALVEAVRIPGAGGGAAHVGGNGAGVDGDGVGSTSGTGILKVLTSGPVPPDPGEFVNASRLATTLEQLT